MKPFNLAEALAGKPIITRCGYPARLLAADIGADIEERIDCVAITIITIKD